MYFKTNIHTKICVISAKNKKQAQSNLTRLLGYKYGAIFIRISKAEFDEYRTMIEKERIRQLKLNCYIF